MSSWPTETETLAFLERLSRQANAPAAPRSRASSDWPTWITGNGNRGLDAASRDRTVADWLPGGSGPNVLHQNGGRLARERARDLVQNNPIAWAALDAYVSNVIEQGITPKPAFADEEQRRVWQQHWDIWSGVTPVAETEIDLLGDCTTYDLQALMLAEVITAGGCLIHFVHLPRQGRRLPLAVELIPEERFCEMNEGELGLNSKTRTIISGCEINPATGKTEAYWVWPTQPDNGEAISQDPIRISRDQARYAFVKRRIGQRRGMTWLITAIVTLWRLGYYTDAEMVAAQMKANWAYFVENSALDEGQDLSQALADMAPDEGTRGYTDYYGNTIERTEKGQIYRCRKGDSIKAVGPNIPGGDSIAWIQFMERLIAIGSGLSRIALTRDVADANLSAARGALAQDKKRYRRGQTFVRDNFCNPIWREFCQAAVRAGLDTFPSPEEFAANLEDYLRVTHRFPGWEFANPIDDAKAGQILLGIGATTREDIIAAGGGGDWEDKFDQLGREKQKADGLGLLVDPNDLPQSSGSGNQPQTGGAN